MIDRSPSKVALVLADVDGTLLTTEKVLTARAVEAVRALAVAGIGFAITSGRPPRGMAMLIAPLDLRTPIAGFNGGVFVHPHLSVIESHTLEPAIAKRTVDLMLDQGLDAWVYTADEWLIRRRDAPHLAREAWTVKFDAKVVPLFTDEHLAHAVKIVGISDDLKLVAACEILAQKKLGKMASAARSQPYYLDVTHPLANKGDGIVALCAAIGVPLTETAAIGDMPNDIPMLKQAGLAIAMGQASAEVKAEAGWVSG